MRHLLVDKKFLFLVVTLVTLTLWIAACAGDVGLQVGDEAPDFALNSAQGNQISKADYSGQPVLLYFHMAMG